MKIIDYTLGILASLILTFIFGALVYYNLFPNPKEVLVDCPNKQPLKMKTEDRVKVEGIYTSFKVDGTRYILKGCEIREVDL